MSFPKYLRLLAVASFAVTCLASHAAAKNYGEGRVYNPSKLRTQPESAPRGRSMKRPSIPEPEERQPVRSTALIPNPEPSSRGGSGYQRNGKYFYSTPRDIELKRVKSHSGYNPTIPRPEPLDHQTKPTTSGTSSTATAARRSSGSGGSSGVDYYNTGRPTGGLGNFGDR